MVEPATTQPERRPRLWIVLIAAALPASVAAHFAPDPWPAGPGELVISRDGQTIARLPVTVGNGDAVRREIPHGVIELPAGVPTEGALRTTVQVLEEGQPIRPFLDYLRFDLLLPDGRSELVPVVRWDEGASHSADRRVLAGDRVDDRAEIIDDVIPPNRFRALEHDGEDPVSSRSSSSSI